MITVSKLGRNLATNDVIVLPADASIPCNEMIAFVTGGAEEESPAQGWFLYAHGIDANEGELVGDMEVPINPDQNYTVLELEEVKP